MENENFTFDVTDQKLLPTHVFERCTDCKDAREEKRRRVFINIIKVIAVVTVLSACFTAVACAIYCNSALKDIRHLHADIMKVTNDINEQKSELPANIHEAKGSMGGKHISAKPLVSTRKVIAEKKGQNDDWFLEDIAEGSDAFEEYDEESEYSEENESANDIAYNNDDYGYTDDDEYDDYDDDYFDDIEDEYYDEIYDSSDDASDDNDNNNEMGENNAGASDYLDIDDDIEETSGEILDDEDLNRVRRDTGSQKEKKEKNRKGKGRKGKGKKGGKGDKKQNKKARKQKRLKSLPAAQFNADMTLERLMEIDAGYNMYENTGKPLGIFKKEEWVAESKSPVTMKDKRFLVKNNGTHLVIGQLFMEGSQYPVSASIVRERVGVEPQYLTCMNNCINYTCTCSMFGLMNLKSGDVLYMQTNNGINKIFFEEAATYIGVVQLNRD